MSDLPPLESSDKLAAHTPINNDAVEENPNAAKNVAPDFLSYLIQKEK